MAADPRLEGLLRDHLMTPCYKVLLCSQDVADGMGPAGAGAPDPLRMIGDPAVFLGTADVVISPDSPPGYWKLTRHDHCTVRNSTVYHSGCTVLGESSVNAETPA